MRNSGKSWEHQVVLENQALYNAGLAVVTRVPTHDYAGPSKEPKVDFAGSLAGGRAVFFEAKSGTGRLTRPQRALLAAHARMGALAFVYHSDGYVRLVDGDGELGEKITVTKWWEVLV
jgi:hypothetical protein